ncbi:protein FANTASTIC FOUR 1-like [Pyrus x bretschneideri]|uniref:protein FANTASTIC FOUR 1-like n=1 Tax=Pyrus x bretschneideri TaxID=225117 RepID=UPI002030279E|nr:protein FANTASTIC FOUR 1-like [Pyrus x bretschneideri]
MATIVCQGLQSCLESHHLVEPRTLRLKFSAPVAHHISPIPTQELGIKGCFSEEKCNNYEEINNNKATSEKSDLVGGWSFLQAISKPSLENPTAEVDEENNYTPPRVYRSSSVTKLNEKSLEMCTEDLGCETGAIITESFSIFSPMPESESNAVPRERQHKPKFSGGKKMNNIHGFPPPLTTISGEDSLQVRPHREDGRLIMKAVKAPLSHTFFQAERSNGHLRLCFSKTFSPSFDSEEAAATHEYNEGCENEACENDINEEEAEQDQEEVGENKEEELEEEEEEEEGKRSIVCLMEGEEVDGNSLNVGGDEGMDKFKRPSRCKEGGGECEEKGWLKYWEPYLVST